MQTLITNKSALAGVKVLDFGWSAAGPLATKMLASFGADVVKVESRSRPDMLRMSSPFKDNIADLDRSGFFLWSNTGKLSVELDITKGPGLQLVKRLVKWCDVVVENFNPSVMARLGLGYQDLVKIKPDLVMASLSVVGQAGPLMGFRGWGNAAQAMSGHSSLIGWPDRGPSITPIFWADVTEPILAVGAIVSALAYRKRTGQGQYLDISQVEVMTQLISPAILDHEVNGREMPRMGNRSLYAAPHGAFRCAGDDKWCTIAVVTDEDWRNFVQAIGNPAWTGDPKFSTLVDRKKNEDELEQRVAEWTSQYTARQAMEMLQAHRVAAGVVLDAGELIEQDPHFKARGCFVPLEHPVMGVCNHPYPPIRLSKTPAELRTAPCLGEHTEYVCTELLGMSDEEFVETLAALTTPT